MISAEQLEALRQIDSPTVANAIEAFEVRDATEGYTSLELRCMFPELPPVVGYAVTCTVDSTTPGKTAVPRASQLATLYTAVHVAPKPAIVVMMDIGPQPLRLVYRMCHRQHMLRRSRFQLIDEVDDPRQFVDHVVESIFIELQPGQQSDVLNLFSGQRHESIRTIKTPQDARVASRRSNDTRRLAQCRAHC